ncbi:hypothetical protein DSO57_1020312 [Entomophthora muscae]|uniref:Uncharacterized protein n=1 Tax=Entomophthora muscae TaxID=34485 RepID=A0ACC2TQN4_9FUNG|nr:hypothetical protein DSO57_1020312 [Entomophthora muscae]
MEPPVTPKPMPASSHNLPTDHTSKLFGIVYIALTEVIDTIILAAGLWSWVGRSFSYLFKLAPLLWWALPANNLVCIIPENDGPAAQAWIPDTANPHESWVLQLAGQVNPHVGTWGPWATAINYLVNIAPTLYMAFQALLTGG